MALTSAVADHLAKIPDDNPYWSDSSWFSWAVPEKGICGFFYNHFRPNMNCLLAGPAMWDANGRHPWEFVYYDWQLMRELPRGRYGVDYDKYDFEAPCSMSIRMLEPLKRYRLGYDQNGFRLDLVFEAVAEPNVVGVHAEGGFEQAYRLHFEQPGRITGSVSLDGEAWAVDCFSIRDGSHGPRNLNKIVPGGYAWSTADAGTGWHVMGSYMDHGRDARLVGGYILRDGEMSPVVSGVRRVLERDGAQPRVVEIEATDRLGRTLHATGRAKALAEFILFSCHGNYWSLFEWDYDGVAGATGEDQEYYSLDDFRRWRKAGPEAWRLR